MITIEKKWLVDSLASVMPAVPNRSSLPILSGVKFQETSSRFAIYATDLEFTIRLQGPAKGTDWESTVIPAKAFAKAVKSMPGPDITIEFVKNDERPEVNIASGPRRISIECFSAENWPETTAGIDWKPVCSLDSKAFADALSRAALCASLDDARPVLTGVQFNFEEKNIQLVATDSYRLGVLSIDAEANGEHPSQPPIVPAKALKALAKQLKKHEGPVRIFIGEAGGKEDSLHFIEFAFGLVSWVVRVIPGDFPNWKQLIPGDSGSTFEFDSAELAAAVKGTADIRSSKTTPIRINLGDECVLRIYESGERQVSEALEKGTYSPNGVGPMEIAFNPDFLTDGIRFVAQEQGSMRLTDAVKPVLLNGEADCRYVLMPVRLSG